MSQLKRDLPQLGQLCANHLAASLLGYILTFYPGQLAAAFVASLFPQRGVLFLYGIELYPLTITWIPSAIVYTYITAPCVALLIAVTAKMLHYSHFRFQPGYAKVLLLWCYLHGAVQFFGGTITGLLSGRGMGHSFYYGFVPGPFKVMFGLVSLVVLFALGIRSGRYLVSASPNEDLVFIHDFSRWRYLVFTALLPWLLTMGLTYLWRWPETRQPDMLVQLSMGLVMIPVVLLHRQGYRVVFHEQERAGLRWQWLVLAGVLMLALFFGLKHGIAFEYAFRR